MNDSKNVEVSLKLKMVDKSVPKHMPHKPCSSVRMITKTISPLHSTWNTTIMNISTKAVWPHMTTNWVMTWENRTSNGVTPGNEKYYFSVCASSLKVHPRSLGLLKPQKVPTKHCYLPATQLRSKRPSVRSTIRADDVNATAKKNTILKIRKNSKLF